MIGTCTCKNTFQDNRYGPGRRIMNRTGKGMRCTGCDKEHIRPVKIVETKPEEGNQKAAKKAKKKLAKI